MKFITALALLFAAGVTAQDEDCEAAYIVTRCLSTETAKADACETEDYDCLCAAYEAIATYVFPQIYTQIYKNDLLTKNAQLLQQLPQRLPRLRRPRQSRQLLQKRLPLRHKDPDAHLGRQHRHRRRVNQHPRQHCRQLGQHAHQHGRQRRLPGRSYAH